jgi:hypothetical protein
VFKTDIANYFALNNKCHIFAPQVRAHQVQSGDENFEGGLITALCVFRKYTITEGRILMRTSLSLRLLVVSIKNYDRHSTSKQQ